MDKQHIIDEIKRTAEANSGKPLGLERFYNETGIRTAEWYGKYWVRWREAVIEAGYTPNKMNSAYEDDWLIEQLIAFIREIGRYPVDGELRLRAKQDQTFPSRNVFTRLGKKAELAGKILLYCNGRDGFEDVAEICRSIASSNNSESDSLEDQRAVDEGQQVIGYVYLMKSGRYHKIGRTTSLGRKL